MVNTVCYSSMFNAYITMNEITKAFIEIDPKNENVKGVKMVYIIKMRHLAHSNKKKSEKKAQMVISLFKWLAIIIWFSIIEKINCWKAIFFLLFTPGLLSASILNQYHWMKSSFFLFFFFSAFDWNNVMTCLLCTISI